MKIRQALSASLGLLALAACSSLAEAQAMPPPRPPDVLAPGAPPAGDAGLPPYEPQLDRLAELMGMLSYMRELCNKGDGSEWRDHMTALLESEATTLIRRARLAGAYNRGFKDYEVTYRTCTPAAQAIIARSLVEGDRLSRELSSRFGGS